MSAKLSRYDLEISKACRRFSNELQKSKKRVNHGLPRFDRRLKSLQLGKGLPLHLLTLNGQPLRKWFQIWNLGLITPQDGSPD